MLDTCFDRPEKYITEALELVTKFRGYKAVLRNLAILPRFRFRFRFRVPIFFPTVPAPVPVPVQVPVPTFKCKLFL